MAASQDRHQFTLQMIFSFFLGLMVVAFIGVGVNTFYQSPDARYQREMEDISRQESAIFSKTSGKEPSKEQQAELDRLNGRRDELQRKIDDQMRPYARNTSIILVLFATLVMGISLIRSEQLRVLSNGLLLGGFFSMLYGTGWVMFSGNSIARFLVILFALSVTVGLGYAKFVRVRAEAAEETVADAGAAPADAAETAALGALSARVAALEARADAAARALGGTREDDER